MPSRTFFLLFVFLGIACESLAAPEITLDRNTFIDYKFYSGEFGGGSTSVSVYGDGSVAYVQRFPMPYDKAQIVNRNLMLDKAETISIFKLLIDAGLLTLKNHAPVCCDIDGVSVSGKINSQPYNAVCQFECEEDWALLRSNLKPLFVRLHPERWSSTNENKTKSGDAI